MKALYQFAALAAVLAVLAVPASAISACWASSPADPHACCMSGTSPAMTLNRGDSRPCCRVSSGLPAPAAQLQAPTNVSRAAVALAAAGPVEIAAAPVSREFRGPLPLKLPGAAQAVLCTFLI